MPVTRFLFADQLGPHFDDGGPIVLVEAVGVLGRRPYHRAKAHLILSALRHRARELGDRVEFLRAEHYRDVLSGRPLEVIDPTSWGARALVAELGADVLPSRGFVTSEADFADWAAGRPASRLVLEQFYRSVRARTGVLMRGPDPEGGRFNFDHDNRRPPPRGAVGLGLPDPWTPVEDEIDAEVRRDLDRLQADGRITLIGRDGPRRFAATRAEALAALDDFIETRLNDFGPFEDASLRGDDAMAHSRLSVPLNLGLLHPREVIDAVVSAHASGAAPLQSVEAVVRQLMGWRDWVWHLYWHLGPDYVGDSNFLGAHEPLPRSFRELDGSGVRAACVSHVLNAVADTGWAHHIQRLMILGNQAMQRGYHPGELNDWFIAAFVDGTPWVMPANVVGMSQHADGGIVATKPYASGGAYISTMSDFCGGCPFNPKKRLGEDACPFTAGYWAFLDRVEPRIRGNHRMSQPLAGLRRLADREAVVAQERSRTVW
ncbi:MULTISPECIES: cryptochrome/photolyase family protein [unclassified Cryobacterium]|uniref:cryptochrome/photolyase family protein n=1 Tax=unclassified Cryobacterium TaxID=2649013 RepID=UPI001069C702|nr:MULTISPECIES: cryptochrome/photolyase family protein [unclassified Cryobacterium]TFC06640.1 cryptochrome/photolyase family protein [Cryobacterium sp. MDB2-33-2]TFC13893.1 cryptochrome/photolyase family protein [Cryobacterium sp. MDB2-10]TFC27716.1 cryptochrome/photolyase family protein [Cryobacterium sp. MDB1-18-2]TFC39190.1 cryptochrome/photolyase family protein [Cryobacterium sp. MDB1-18-1]